MVDNFVSYARDDRALITNLVTALEGEGFTVFWDPDIPEGEDWELYIEDKLNAAKAVLVAWTSTSRRSQWVRAEAHEAHRQRKLIPLQLDAAGPPLFFKTVQTADFIGWEGDKSAECWQRLTIMLKGVMEAAERQAEEGGGEAPSPEPVAPGPARSPDERGASSKKAPEPERAPKPLHATPQGGVPWLTLFAMALSVIGLIIASQLHLGVFGGAIVIAAVIFILFRTADSEMPPAFHALAKRWLMPVRDGLRINVAEAFHDMFKAVFWHRHLSWRCFARSALASTLAFAAIFAFAWFFIEPFQTAFRAEWGSFLRNLVITFLIANILADYVSLFQTRLFIRFLERQPWTAPLVVVVDFLATIAILLVVLYVVNASGQWMGHAFSAGPGETPGELGGPRDHAPAAAGFTWPSFMGFYQGLIPQLSNPDAGVNDLWARSWLLIVASITTYITSVWLVFIMVFGGALRVLVGRDGEPTWLGRALQASQRPFTAFGGVSAALVLALAVPVFALEVASEVRGGEPRPTPSPTPSLTPSAEIDPAEAERQAWSQATNADTLQAYRRYIDDYPLGPNMAEARRRITALEEAQAWSRAQTADTIEAYRRYLFVYSDTDNAASARARILEIERDSVVADEQAAWAQARREDTIGAYERYMRAHADGPNAAAAQTRMAALQDEALWRAVQDEGTRLAYELYLQRAEARSPSPPTYAEPARAAIDAHAAAVERVQQALFDKGFDPRGVDGAAGPGTVSAAEAFVRASGELTGGAPDFEVIDAEPLEAFAVVIEAWEPAPAVTALDARITPSSTRVRVSAVSPGSLPDFALFKECEACPEMAVMPTGRFLMGSPASEPGKFNNEGPQRQVTIANRFAVGRFEVTWAEWQACVLGGDCQEPSDRGWGRGQRPVINVSWNDAQAYVQWLNGQVEGTPYRLLSEAEWEYATRAGTTTPYSTGQSITTAQANFDGDTFLEQTVPVGSYGANPFGLFDVHGNVREWAEDCYHDSYSGAPDGGQAWVEDNCANRVFRGGSWGSYPRYLRSAYRGRFTPGLRNINLGFRLARTLSR